ncbi:TolC family protein [Myxococcus sp. MxC21-1]|uniref:TolC family protein n=1 Tax=Myxococcus sp. MxC21-1 TaxID=3041439 RepID=UPI0029313C47|nr:TolC family protein [Myxococcus sp. MxC21-1]WNZ63249.1 TolC family protein [Myxococcus sp. MxC21-1]
MPHPLTVAAFGLAAALLFPRVAAAQPGSADAALSLEETLALARQRAPALLDAAGRAAEAQGPVAAAASLLNDNPTFELQAGPAVPLARREPRRARAGLERGHQPAFELGGKGGARRASARAGLEMETALQRDAERRVLGDVAARFLQALHARERLSLAREAEAAARETANSAQRRFEAGDVPVVDVNVARVSLARLRAEVATAEGDEAVQLHQLRAMLGLPLTHPLAIRGELRVLALQPVTEAKTDTVAARPDITALEAELAQADADRRMGRASVWPDITAGFLYQREIDETAYLGALSVPLPIFDRGDNARVTGDARVRRLQSLLAAARVEVDVQVEAARVQHRKRLEAVTLLEADALPLLNDNERLARRSYEAGEMGLAEFLLVRRDTLEARAAYLDSLLQAALARIQLAVETGALP